MECSQNRFLELPVLSLVDVAAFLSEAMQVQLVGYIQPHDAGRFSHALLRSYMRRYRGLVQLEFEYAQPPSGAIAIAVPYNNGHRKASRYAGIHACLTALHPSWAIDMLRGAETDYDCAPLSICDGFGFADRSVDELALPSSIVQIGSDFFAQSSLRSVQFDGLTQLHLIACDCLAHTSVTVVDLSSCTSLRSVGECFLWFCVGLRSVALPPSLETIGDYFLAGCTSIEATDLIHCTALVDIGDYFVAGCESLRRVVLPESIVRVHRYFLEGCRSVELVDLSRCTALISISNDELPESAEVLPPPWWFLEGGRLEYDINGPP